jgi:secreted Zn-dependent insulinase-like peptidase
LSIRDKVAAITDEEFLVQRKAVHTKLAEKDINLSYENHRFWYEIVTHNYDFDIQNNSLKELEKVTKEDFQAHVQKVFFSNQSKRLDL